MNKLELIKRNTEEIVTEKELVELLKKKKLSVYLGTAITGRPHIGYFIWVLKLSDFLRAGLKVTLLLADLHGALDNTKWDVLEKRYNYYKAVIPLMFKAIDVDIKDFNIIKGSDFQLRKEYVLDVFKMSTFTTIHDCKKAASEVVKFGDNPMLSGLIYPIMQALDEVYLDVDIQYGGVDQRKILMFARENLPKLGYKPRVEIMTPMIPGLIGEKMSASIESSKIDLLDDEKTVDEKIRKAYCPEGVIENNGVLAFLKYVVMIIKQDRNEKFIVKRDKKYGGDLIFSNYNEIEDVFVKKELHPLDLKNALASEVNKLLEPIRNKSKELNKIVNEAY
ncbi:MAG: tyrosine--tRNA ligase [archaeon]